ncbi:MAG: hypothetical protein UW63_C0006G0001, partial [Candidatus Uhrbacteria bacterium GW2011_GWF2_44_350]
MFINKFFQTFAAIIGFMVAYTVIGLPIFLMQNSWPDGVFVILLTVWSVGSVVFFLAFFFWIIGKIWVFHGADVPATPLEVLKNQLLEINSWDAPVEVKETKNGLVFTWKYVDAKWWELFKKAGLIKVYELHAKFNENKDTVYLTDVSKTVSWGVGPTEVRISAQAIHGIQAGFDAAKQLGVKENFSLGTVMDYRFSPSEIKNPVMNTILKNGWDVKFR